MHSPILVNFLMKSPRALALVGRYISWRNDRARRNHKCLWRCYRDGGGGKLITPKPMTEDAAVAWVGRVANAEVFHVDFDSRMIFYRSTGSSVNRV